MPLASLVLALLTSAAMAVTAAGMQSVSRAPPVMIHAQSLDTLPASRSEGDEAMDAAVAAAVIGAVSRQFGQRDVAVKLDQVAVEPASLRDRAVSGNGRLQIDADLVWIPFRFAVLYDTVGTTASYPQLQIGGSEQGHEIAVHSKVAVALLNKVDAALRTEFPQQPAAMKMEHITTTALGRHYLQVKGTGTANFGREGITAAHVDAIYDPRNGQWLRVEYELGTTSNWAGSVSMPVAVR